MKDSNQGFLDRVFLHNKNADERLFDLILRSATFIVLLLIVLLYSTISVHADSGSSLMSLFNIDSHKLNPNYVPPANSDNRAFFNSDDYNFLLQNVSDFGSAFYSMGTNADPTTFHPPFSWDPYIASQDFSGVDVQNNCIICCRYYFSGLGNMIGYVAIPKQLFIDGKVMFGRGGTIYATEDFDYQVASTWTPLTTQTFSASGSPKVIDLQQALSTANCYFCSCPYWDGNGFVGEYADCASDVLSHHNDPFYYTDKFCNLNYFMWGDVSNMSDSFVAEDVENAENHMYLKDVQIALTSSSNGSDITSSQVCIGVEGDDYLQNHLDEFDLSVNYHLYCKDSDSSIPDPDANFYQSLPIQAFRNNAYTYAVSDIFSNAVINHYGSFYEYYRNITSSHDITVRSDSSYNAYIPTIFGNVNLIKIGTYTLDKATVNNFSIFDMYLEVTIQLRPKNFNTNSVVSGTYTKKFNFMNGNSSVTNADIFVNPNPWEGSSTPEVSPNVPGQTSLGDGSGASAYARTGDVNVIVNNGISNNLVNGVDPEESEDIFNRYTNMLGEFKDNVTELSSMGEDNGFLGFLRDTYDFIPGLNYITISCGVIFGLAVILFIIKVLLF